MFWACASRYSSPILIERGEGRKEYEREYFAVKEGMGIDKRLKDQEKNLNKVYRDVTPATEEMLNNREDSVYLSILSEKRTVEMEMTELRKAGRKRAQQISAQQQSSLQPLTTAQPSRPVKPSKPNFPRKRPGKPSKK